MLAAIVCGWALGIGLSTWLAPWWLPPAVLGPLVAWRARLLPLAVGCALVLPGACWMRACLPVPGPNDVSRLAPRRFVRLEAVVATPPARVRDGWRARLAIAGTAVGTVDGVFPSPDRPWVGSRWELAGRLSLPQGPQNPGEPDQAARLARQGVFARFRAEEARQLGPAPGWAVARAVDHLRMALVRGLGAGLSPDRAALLGSLTLGTGASPVDPELAERFRSIGLSHLLAASGAQVGLLTGLGYAGALRLGLTPPWSAGLTLPLLLIYLALTGAPASMVRATWMGAVVLGALAFERQTVPYAALWVAAGLMLLADPGALLDLGFQFSFLATYALCRLADAGKPPTGWIRTSLTISFAANLWVTPWQLYVFQQGSLLALPANLVAEPLVLALTPWGLAVAVLGALWAPLAAVVAPITNLALATLEGAVWLLAAIPWGAFTVAAFPCSVVALIYLALWAGRKRPWVLSGALTSAAGIWVLPALEPAHLDLAFLSVGQGDALIVHAPGDHWIVVDAGPAHDDDDAGTRTIIPYLRRQGCRHLDLAIASHAHLDHVGGFPALAHAVPIGAAWDPGQWDHAKPYQDLLGAWLANAVPWEVVHAGLAWQAGGVKVEALSRCRPEATTNDGSIVARLTYGGFRVLLMGDTEAAGEAALLAGAPDMRADVLKVGHHGSKTSSTPALLDAVHPRLAVISVGTGNRFGHPSPEVVERLAATGAQVLRTDEHGAVLVRVDDRGVRWSTGPDWATWQSLPGTT
ncbi:MAG: ComE-like competence protein [Cyanobacteria bacterium RYN_339]|nr:ComE-like competence protein [Cyanobacteria bacterium RYN_339]